MRRARKYSPVFVYATSIFAIFCTSVALSSTTPFSPSEVEEQQNASLENPAEIVAHLRSLDFTPSFTSLNGGWLFFDSPKESLYDYSWILPMTYIASPADSIFPFDYTSSGSKNHTVLHLPGSETIWIMKYDYREGRFVSVHKKGPGELGIGGYDLRSGADRSFAFDYDSSGKLDHLVFYRPGTGTLWILKNTKGNFAPVFKEGDPGKGIGGFDLKSSADRVLAFDYDHSGHLDHLVLYRPGTGMVRILKKGENGFSPVYGEVKERGRLYERERRDGIGGYDLKSNADRMLAFDYDSTGKQDHLVLYRPGTGTIWILKNDKGKFSPVYKQGDPGNGIAGYNLRCVADLVFTFDYNQKGKEDHLGIYRRGTGIIWILKKNNGNFTVVNKQGDPEKGIGGYDLKSEVIRILIIEHLLSGLA